MIDELKDNILFKSIFHSSVEGILVINDSGVIIKANPASEQMFGYNKQELINKTVEDLIPNQFKKNHKSHRDKYSKKPKSRRMGLDLDLWGLKKDGSQFPLEISLSPTEIENKQLVIAFVIDITERMAAKQALLASESRMAEAQRLAHVGNWHWNIQTDERSWSDEFYRILGLPPGDKRLNSESVRSFIHPDDKESTIQAINEAVKNKTPYKHKQKIVRPDGTVRHILAKGKTIYDAAGKPEELYGSIQDITRHKDIELKLKKSKEKTQALLQALPDVMILYDKHGNHLEVHAPENYQLVAPYDDHIGNNIDKILPKKVCDKIRKGFADCEKTKENQIVEYSLTIMGKLTHFESRIVKTDTNNFLCIIRDITESENAEKKILDNEQRLRLALEAGEFGSWDWNLLSDTIVRDKYQNSLFGMEAEENIINYSDFLNKIHPEDRDKVQLAITQAIKKTSNYNVQYRITHPDLSIHWLQEKGKVFKNQKGKPERIIGVTNSITKQKLAEEKLKESEEKLREYTFVLEEKVAERTKELTTVVQKLVESNLSLEDQINETKEAENKALSSMSLLHDISHNFPKGFVAVCNSDFNLLLVEGEEVDELGFKGLASAKTLINDVIGVPDDVKEKVKRNVLKTFQGEHCSFEVEYQNRTYLINSTPLYDAENKINQVLMVHHNITHQKETELEMLNTLKKERELSELKSRFISMASHEFRTPLSAILSSAILIEKQNEPGKEDKRIGYVTKIRSNVKNLVVILNDFLSLGKLQEGKVIAHPESFNLIDFSKSLIEEMEDIKKEDQIINLQCEHSSIKVFLDSKLLKHILYNLVSNAIKYSEEQQEINIKIAIKNQLVCIDIKDKGIGIPAEDQDHLFQRFYRANNASNIQGTGLGLNIVKQYTELMGGTITFKSEINKGSTFSITFPLNETKDE
ncbi:PAS domain S-box protein [Lacinutrix sp. WUR7]|uniref:sensor histidine kinase n=1 Tax=Lacinutrix sp. WUR7 TaxID=2653681 RepID=UPI00193D59DE|nr:PAS domain S-box protein [Lacinutrix sp. WUR7]QRM90800.1 PAS domain S-box protein [Lacinutrix sp. WUR7]